jgi:hypothetical protein
MDSSPPDRIGVGPALVTAWNRSTTGARVLLVAWGVVPLLALGGWLALRAPTPDRITVLSPEGSIAFVKRHRLAQDASAAQRVKALVPVMESCWAQTQDFTQCSLPEQLKQYGGAELPLAPGQAADAETVAATATSVTEYTIAAGSRTGGEFAITRSADGSLHRTCSIRGTDGCRADGTW